jgi:pimeloyl-ACP methyl ester carboxylesterase
MPHTESRPRIYFETAGDEAHPPVVLIEGLGAQMIGWRDGFVDQLVERGLHVIRLDNRDVGLSEMLGSRDEHLADYALADMAADVAHVLDALKLPSAHIVGQSMGGAIAQTLAIKQPDRVSSMVLIYTTPAIEPAFLGEVLLQGAADFAPSESLSRDEAVAAYVDVQRMSGSPAYEFDEVWLRELGGLSFDRAYRPDGILRQLSVMLRSEDRRADLAAITIPVAIIHGRDDRLVRPEASIEMARLMPTAELHLYPGLGHQVAKPLWGEFATIIERTVRRA